MNKNSKRYLVVFGIILVIYNLLVFVIPFKHVNASTFIFTWLFGLIAILVQPIIFYISLKDSDTLKSKFYGWPIIKLGYTYMIIQLIISLIFFILGIFLNVPTWIIILISLIIVGVVSIGLIGKQTYKEEIIKMEENEPVTTKFISDLKVDSEVLLSKIKVQDIKIKFNVIVEEIKYSDPVSSDSTLEIEDEINRKYIEFKESILNSNYDNIINILDELLSLIQERNKRIKLGKR